MHKKALRSDILMLLTSCIWGFAFVAQRRGMEHVGPFLFNGIRFALGSLSLLPLLAVLSGLSRRKGRRAGDSPETGPARKGRPGRGPSLFLFGIAAGTALFAGASLQQVGIVYTGAGKAGFITGLYVVLVPMLGMLLGARTGLPTWVGAGLAAIGLYFISVEPGAQGVNIGDVLVAVSALFWAIHVLLIDRYSKRVDPVALSAVQFAWTALLSLLVAATTERIVLADILAAAVPILYGGLGSVGVAYTLQVVAQKDAPPAHAAILLSLEGVFAGIGGSLLLAEPLTARSLTGCGLMLTAMLATQWEVLRPFRRAGAIVPGSAPRAGKAGTE